MSVTHFNCIILLRVSLCTGLAHSLFHTFLSKTDASMRLIVIYLFTTSLILQISVAKSELCNGKVCISKCCENNRYVLGKKVCVPYDKLELSNFEVHNKNLSLVGQFSDYFEVKPGLFSDEKVRTESFYYLRFYSSFRLFEVRFFK